VVQQFGESAPPVCQFFVKSKREVLFLRPFQVIKVALASGYDVRPGGNLSGGYVFTVFQGCGGVVFHFWIP
jgi:hypothetical protein